MKILIIVDAQNDFINSNGGTLVVPDAEQIIPKINELTQSKFFDTVIATQDWHPKNHVSFADRWNVSPFSLITLPNTDEEMVWPIHCVQGTWGADFPWQLDQRGIDMIIRKGTNIDVDSYSALFDNEILDYTPLVNYLNSYEEIIKTTERKYDIYVCGVATDVCVLNTVQDLQRCYSEQFNIHLIQDACAAVSEEGKASAIYEMLKNPIIMTEVNEVLNGNDK